MKTEKEIRENIDDLTSSEIDDLIEQLIFQKVEIESQKTAKEIINEIEAQRLPQYDNLKQNIIVLSNSGFQQLKQKFLR